MSVYFWSDLHIGHRKIAELRGYDEVEAHDADLAHSWDGLVGKNDVVWVLGDISAGGSKAQRDALMWFAQRAGHKHLIAGNHDGSHPMHRDAYLWIPTYLESFESVQSMATRRVPYPPGAGGGHQTVLLSHFPYTGEGDRPGEDRFTQYRLRDEGLPVIHGHTHVANSISYSKAGTRQIHVGADTWPKPVSLEQLSDLLED